MNRITKYYLLQIAIISISFTSVFGQLWYDDEEIYNEAEGFLIGEEYEEALSMFKLLESKGVINSNISYKIGLCFLNIEGSQYKSIPFFEKAAENISAKYENNIKEIRAPINSLMKLAVAYRMNYQFDKAISTFEKLKLRLNNEKYLATINFNIEQCKRAKLMIEQPSNCAFSKLNVQSGFPVYNPCVSGTDQIFYMEKKKFYDAIMEADLKGVNIVAPRNITPAIGSDGELTLVSVSNDGNTLIFTAFDADRGYELFYSVRGDNKKWKKHKRFEGPINSNFNEISACLTSDGNTIFFCSNRIGGQGGTDIYVSNKIAGSSWSEPVNLGKIINTPYNESSVAISADGQKSFFSSEGHLNMGGHDLFMTERDNSGRWKQPVNLGSPISTPMDDKFINVVNTDSNVFYVHRIRKDVDDKLNLYKISMNEGVLPVKQIQLKGKLIFTNSIPAKRVDFIVVDNSEQDTVLSSQTREDGAFDFILNEGNYMLKFNYDDEVFAKKSIKILENYPADELLVEVPPWELPVSSVDTVTDKMPKILYIRDILFSFDSYVILPEYMPMLDSISTALATFSEATVTIYGHTDALGDKEYNNYLSEKRAINVEKFIVNKGISSKRIGIIPRGERSPIAKNINADGSDNTTGRKYNRRVEIDIIAGSSALEIKKIVTIPATLKLKR